MALMGGGIRRRTHELLSAAYQLIRRLGSARWMRAHGQPQAPDLEAALHILVLTSVDI